MKIQNKGFWSVYEWKDALPTGFLEKTTKGFEVCMEWKDVQMFYQLDSFERNVHVICRITLILLVGSICCL
jgi:hypothetical protein